MRDPARIPKVAKLLEDVWKKNPDLRLGQLIIAITKPSMPCPDVFYMEDDEMIDRLNKFGSALTSAQH